MNASAAPFIPKTDPVPPAGGDHEAQLPAVAKESETSNAMGVVQQEVDERVVQGTALWRPRYSGRLKSFNDQKGFGFIECPETLRSFKRDVFIHRYQVMETGLWVGQEVTFEVETNKQGCPQARSVRPVNMEGSANWEFGMGAHDAQNGGYGAFFYGMAASGGFRDSQSFNYGKGSAKGLGPGIAAGPPGGHGAPEPIETMLRKCSGSADMWEVIEHYGHSFGKKHVVTALYQLGLCHQYERRTMHVSLTTALVDRLVLFPARELTAEEASRVLWALALLEEMNDHANAHLFAMELGKEASVRFHEYSPAQMATLVSSLSRLARSQEEEELVGKITTNFSDFALAGGTLPRFPPEEIRIWTNFLQEVSSMQPSQQPGQYPYSCGGRPPMNQYNPAMQLGMMPPWPGSGLAPRGSFMFLRICFSQ